MNRGWQTWGMVLGWGAYAGWASVLFVLSSQPPQDLVGMTFPHADKVLHFVYFGIGGFLFMAALSCSSQMSARLRILWATFVAVAMGFLDEWHQMFTPGRHGGDFYDFAADVAGGLAGLTSAFLIYEWIKRRFTPIPHSAAPSGD
ncbi:MAG: VanZ family protein [Terrimicrobiaceae bacterium]